MSTVISSKLRVIAWLVLMTGIVVMTLLLRKIIVGDKNKNLKVEPPRIIMDKLIKAEEDYLRAKTKNEIYSDVIDTKITEISEISDGSERRRQLAELMKNM